MKFKKCETPSGEIRTRRCFLFFPKISLPDENNRRSIRWLEYATFTEYTDSEGLWVTEKFID